MQYFQALKMGQKRVESSRAYLNSVSNDRAMPALALRDNKTNVWEPVGEEKIIPSALMLDTRALSINKSKLIILASAPLLITTSLRKLAFKIAFLFLIIFACKSSLVSTIRLLTKNSFNYFTKEVISRKF